jgi:hypothetical protein
MNTLRANFFSAAIGKRASVWILLSVVLQGCVFLAYPGFICGCHFHIEAFWLSIPAIVLGGYCFFSYRTSQERLVAYIALAFSLGWIWFAWFTNIQFFFMR